jgi:UDP-glucose 4-epimerase
MKIGVTGGSGFIGSNLVKRLVGLGHKLVVVDDLSSGLVKNLNGISCEFHNFSIIKAKELLKVFEDVEVIVHLAARGSVPRSIINPIATHEINVVGTLNILEISKKTGAKLIFTSSSSVYGENTSELKIEKTWLKPISPYAASKLSSEAFITAYANSYGVPSTIFRLFNVFGPFQRSDHEYAAVIPKWLGLAFQGKPIEVFGSGEQKRDFTYVDTVVDVITEAVVKQIRIDNAINLAFGNPISLNQILNNLSKKFQKLEVSFKPERKGDIKNSQSDPSQLRKYFPNINPVDFEAGFEKTFSWLQNNY